MDTGVSCFVLCAYYLSKENKLITSPFQHRSEGNENYDLVKSVLLASQTGRDVTDLGVQQADLHPGTLVIFCGHNSMHRVTPVKGNRDIILAVLSYEQKPDVHLNEYTRMKFYGRLR